MDERAFAVGKDSPFPLETVTLAGCVQMHYVHPARAIPYLFHHPSLHEHMWTTPKAQWAPWTTKAPEGVDRPEQQRVYGHPFTCDMALEALRRMPAGLRHVFIMLLLFKDKTQLARGEKADFDAVYLKLANTGDAAWSADVNKVLFAVFPPVERGSMSKATWKEAKKLVNQICWAYLHILLEDCAEWGIRCNHRCASAATRWAGLEALWFVLHGT